MSSARLEDLSARGGEATCGMMIKGPKKTERGERRQALGARPKPWSGFLGGIPTCPARVDPGPEAHREGR